MSYDEIIAENLRVDDEWNRKERMYIATIVNKHDRTEDITIQASEFQHATKILARRMRLIGAKECLQLVKRGEA